MKTTVLFSQRGFSLISVLLLVGLLITISTALAVRMRIDTLAQAGFHATPRNLAISEAGINQATAQFRTIFVSGNVPTGSSDSHTVDYAPVTSSLGGQGLIYQLDEPTDTNPTQLRLPLGVPFGGLNVSQFNYTVASGTPNLTNPSAQLRSQFQVNNIPTFQFLAYYNQQLDIVPLEDMDLHGRIHTNGSLYMNSGGGTLTITDEAPNIPVVEISAVGNIYRRRSESNTCDANSVIISAANGNELTMGCGDPVSTGTLNNWGGTLKQVQNIGVPPGFSTARLAITTPTSYWQAADLRIVLDLNNRNFTQTRSSALPSGNVSLFPIVVQDVNGAVDATKTTALRNFMHAVPGAIFYNDVPVTADNGTTACTLQADADGPIGSPSRNPPAAPCNAAAVTSRVRYNPPFQQGPTSSPNNPNALVYRRSDHNSGATTAQPSPLVNNRSASWTFPVSSGQLSNASLDQLGSGTPGLSTMLGDYRRGGFYNNRENKWTYLLNVNIQDLLAWNNANGSPLFSATDNSDGGTIIYLSVTGPIANAINNYGVRILDSPTLPGYPLNIENPLGISIISDQAFYIQGNYNSATYAPTGVGPSGIPWPAPSAAAMGDTMNVLSQSWESTIGTWPNDNKSAADLADGSDPRNPCNKTSSTTEENTKTVIRAAFAAGVDNPANGYNGGLHNYPRTHEHWDGQCILDIKGSFVSLMNPAHQVGTWAPGDGLADNMYTPPIRRYDFDPKFNDVAMLPPKTPTFISVQQIVIGQDFR